MKFGNNTITIMTKEGLNKIEDVYPLVKIEFVCFNKDTAYIRYSVGNQSLPLRVNLNKNKIIIE